jgi:hypothetical protein
MTGVVLKGAIVSKTQLNKASGSNAELPPGLTLKRAFTLH